LLYWYYKIPKYSENELSKDFKAVDIKGQPYHHYARPQNEEIVLLSFWGSWCGPCRQKNPEIVKIASLSDEYNQFSVISIPVEKSESAMIKAIRIDGLSELKHIPQREYFKSPIPTLYGVRNVPTSYLIGKDNRVMAVNPDFETVKLLLTKSK
jgi:thiol-disulfide isomerase/thioredoxin